MSLKGLRYICANISLWNCLKCATHFVDLTRHRSVPWSRFTGWGQKAGCRQDNNKNNGANKKETSPRAIWQLPQFIIIQCMPCPVNHQAGRKGEHTLVRLSWMGLDVGRWTLSMSCQDIFTSDLWIIPYGQPNHGRLPHVLLLFVLPNQISLRSFNYMKGSIEPMGLPSNGIHNAILQLRFPSGWVIRDHKTLQWLA